MKIENIKISELKELPDNPTEMDQETFEFLVREIKKKGFLQPILITSDNYIIDGAHRVAAAKILKIYEVPAVIIDAKKHEIQIDRIAMNKIKGSMSPLKLAQNIYDLQKLYDGKKLEMLISFKENEQNDLLKLLKLPDNMDSIIQKQIEQEEKGMPIILSFVVSNDQNKTIQKALKMTNANGKGDSLFEVCKKFIGDKNGK